MKRFTTLLFTLCLALNAFAQADTLSTTPPMIANNGSGGVTFEFESNQPVNMLALEVVFGSTAVTTANLWMRVGGVLHTGATQPNITAANGWTQVIVNAPVSVTSTTAVTYMDFQGNKINVPANTRLGFFVEATNVRYQTGTAADQTTYTDGVASIFIDDPIAWGGAVPTPLNNPRRFVGSVVYEIGITGNCTPFTNFTIDSISATAARVSWIPGAGNNSFVLEHGPAGFTPGTGTTVTGTYPGAQPPVIISGLTTQTAYDVYFYELCNGGMDTAGFPAAQSFTTTKLCSPPTNFAASNVQATQVDLSWSYAGVAQSYDLIYGTTGFDPTSSGTTVSVTGSSPYNLTGINPATYYDAYLVAYCGAANGYSDTAGPVNFLTLCAPVSAPFSTNFDSDPTGSVPNCWFDYAQASGSIVDVVNFGTFNSPPNGLRLYNFFGAGPNDTIMAISPQLSGMTANDKQVSFYAASQASGEQLYIGSISSHNGKASFNPLDTITFTAANQSNEYVVLLNAANGYNGIDEYIAFRRSLVGTFNSIFIDDFKYEVAPPCPNVLANQIALASGATTITINVAGSNLDIEWGPCGFTQGTGTFVSNVGTPYQATGLAPSTCYDVYVRRNCTGSGNGTSSWSGPFSISTTCLPSALPFTESFNTWPLTCWDTTGGSAYWAPYVGAGGDIYAVADFWSNSTGVYHLTSSPIIISQQAQVHFFWSHLANIVSYPDEALLIEAQSLSTGLWDTVLYLKSNDGNFDDPTAGNTSPGSFIESIVQLPASYIGDTIKVRIIGYSDFGPNCYLNNFAVEATPACIPTSLVDITVGSSSDSVSANWIPGSGVSWDIEVGTPGFVPGTGTAVGSWSDTLTTGGVGGLSPNTTYELYLRDSCADGSLSPWVGPIAFTTKCTPIPMTVYESLDNWPVACWDSTGGTDPWTMYTGPSGDNYAEANFWGISTGVFHFTSPPITISQDAQLRFFWSHLYSTFYPNDRLLARVQVAGSATWDTVVDLSGATDFNDLTAQNTAPGSFVMEEVLLDPSKYTGNDIVVEFIGVSGFGPNCYLNDIYVEPAPQCPKPAALSAAVLDTFATFNWVGSSSHNDYEVWFGPQGFYQGSGTVGGHKFLTGGVDSFNVDTLRAATCYEFVVRGFCAPSDTTEWVGPYSFCTNCRPYTMPYYESYDAWSPLCWTIDLGTVDWRGYSAGTDGWAEADFWGNSSGNMIMNSPPVLITEAAQLRYTWSHLANTISYPDDELIVRATVVGSSQWDTLDTKKSGNGNFNDPTAGNTTPGVGIEDILQLDTTKYNGNQIIIQFWGNTDFGPNLFLNDFWIEKVPTCPKPTNLDTANVSASSANLSWSAGTTGNTSFEVEYGVGLTFANIGTGTRMAVTGTNYNLTGLMPATGYCYFVREICAVGDTSQWAGAMCFSTECVPIVNAPYSTNFEGISTGAGITQWENCWTGNSVSGPYWQGQTSTGANQGSLDTGPFYDATTPGVAGGTYMVLETSTGAGQHEIYSPYIDITALANPELEYYYHMYGATIDRLEVYWEDQSGARGLIDSIVGQQMTAGSDPFMSRKASVIGAPGIFRLVYVGVRGTSFTGDIAIDEVAVYDLGGCPSPTNLMSTSVGCDTITVSWTSVSGGSILIYGPQGFLPPAGTATGIVTSPYTITGLSSGTAYDIYAVDTCTGDTSMPAGPLTVSTSGVVVTASFTHTFGTAGPTSRTVFFDASSSVGAVTYDWDFGDGNTGTGQNTSNIYNANGSYIVTLTVGSACGVDSITDTVVVGGIGFAESVVNQTLQLYPNPAKDEVNISFTRVNSTARVALMDLSGKELMVREINNAGEFYSGRIDLSELSDGVYMIQVTDGELVVNRRLIKR